MNNTLTKPHVMNRVTFVILFHLLLSLLWENWESILSFSHQRWMALYACTSKIRLFLFAYDEQKSGREWNLRSLQDLCCSCCHSCSCCESWNLNEILWFEGIFLNFENFSFLVISKTFLRILDFWNLSETYLILIWNLFRISLKSPWNISKIS